MKTDYSVGVSLTPLTDRSIQEYYDNKSSFADYAELTIAGHPAVRANQGDPAASGFCSMFVATKQGQVLSAFAAASADGGGDSCGLAQKTLEASVSTLPSAK